MEMVRRVLALSVLLASIGITGVSPLAQAASVTSGSCTSNVGDSTNVSMSVLGDGSCVLQFKNIGSTTWTVPSGVTEAEVFIVGGGGAGAWSDVYAQGGGGGGGIAHRTGLPVSGTYTVNVGAGGTGTNSPQSWTSGTSSSLTNGTITITANGGGAGAGWGGAVGFNGGSGGGGHWYNSCCDKGVATKGSAPSVTGVTFYGNDGGNSNYTNNGGGGGGGATTAGTDGTAGQVGGNGGEGLSSSITGVAVVYGSGGSGIGTNGGGVAGTNAGTGFTGANGGDGVANTGSGGGGGAYAYRSGHGGSGIVIIKFGPLPSAPVNNVVPSVSGTTTNGQTLTGATGTWAGFPTPTYTYRWKRSSTASGSYTNIAGATNTTYALTDDDIDMYIKFEVTATNASGSLVTLSSSTAKVIDMVRPTTTTTTTTVAPAATTSTTGPALVIDVRVATTVAETIPVLPQTAIAAPPELTSATKPRSSVPPIETSTSTTTTTMTTIASTSSTTSTSAPLRTPSVMAVEPGSVAAEFDGESAVPTIERVENQIVVQVGSINATFSAVDGGGSSAALDGNGNLRLNPGDTVRIAASGFEPNSMVELWLFSTPVRLGELSVRSDGAVTGDFAIPSDVKIGAHRIAIIARTSEGKSTTLALGIRVGTAEDSDRVSFWFIAPPLILAVLVALVLPATRRRRRTAPPLA